MYFTTDREEMLQDEECWLVPEIHEPMVDVDEDVQQGCWVFGGHGVGE